jgi:tetratricopeptide (TPR) repeat protein
METWSYTGGGIANFKQVQRIFARSKKLLGRDFRKDIFLGYNPFGPQNRVCSIFTGYLICPADGQYTFSTTSQDASFLLIDGKVIVSNGRHHRPYRRAVKQGRIKLSRGLHELKVYHVGTGGIPVVVAAWRAPGARRLWKIAPSAFAPVRRAVPGIMERYGRSLHADFIPRHAGETFLANRYFQRYVFEAMLKGRFGPKVQYHWDFGDGQKSSEKKCEHVYLRDGRYKVTLKVKVGSQTLTRTNVIYVSRRWDKVTKNLMDPPANYARIAAGYDFTAADPRDIVGAVIIFKRAGMKDAIIRAGDALVARDKAPSSVLRDAMGIYTDALVRTADAPGRAVDALVKAEKMTDAPDVSAEMLARAGRIALEDGKVDRAMSIFTLAIKKYAAFTTHRAIREAKIGVGDVWRHRGNYDKAAEAYRSAGAVKKTGHAKQAVRKGDLARHAEDYLRRRLFDDAAEALDKWEYEFPADKLEGFSTLVRVKLATARKRYAVVAKEANLLVKVNPRSHYAPELLMLAVDAYTKMRKTVLAGKTLQRIVKDYPESPLAEKAKKTISEK